MIGMIRWAAVASLLLVPPLAGAQPSPPLVITGSTTIYPLMLDIVQRFQASNPGAAFEISSGGSGRGLSDLRAGLSDIGMVSRELVASERDLFPFPLCRDGAAIVVHRSNPLKGLTGHHLLHLLTGD